MKYIFAVFILILISGCEEDYPQERTTQREIPICKDSGIEKRANFTLQCIKNANPVSDEEPEDWIGKCETMANSIYCQPKTMIVNEIKLCKYCDWKISSRKETK